MPRYAIEVAIVLPTFNERDNVGELVRRLNRALAGRRREAIFVNDDSPDQTTEAVSERA
jgi:dolichol-phosphate mannosyltransferase